MSKQKIFSLIKSGIIALLAFMSLMTLSFSLITISSGSVFYSDTGFSMLDFESQLITYDYEFGAVLLGLMSLTMLLASLAAMGLSVFNFILKDHKIMFDIIVLIITGVIAVTYMFMGIIYVAVFVESYGTSLYAKVTTACYVPLILDLLIFGGYIAADKVFATIIKNDQERAQVAPVQATPVQQVVATTAPVQPIEKVENKQDNIELLKKYKELLDDEIITKEEFDAKKKQLLDL